MVFELAVQLAKALDAAGIPYMVIGGLAAIEYGRSRATEDVDITVGVGPEDFAQVAELAHRVGLTPDRHLRDHESFVQQTMLFPCDDPRTGLRVDFIFTTLEYDRQAIRRANTRRIRDYDVRVATLEDVIVMKMVAGRARDIEDVQMLCLRENPDLEYIRFWLKAFREMLAATVDDEFERLLGDLNRRLGS